jgi:hypothetical protein
LAYLALRPSTHQNLYLVLTAIAQERDRARIPDQHKWNLADLYATDAVWRTAKDDLTSKVPRLRAFKGKLGTSAGTLADALTTTSTLDKELSRLFVYASLLADQDTRDAQHQGMKQEMVQLGASLAAEGRSSSPRSAPRPLRPSPDSWPASRGSRSTVSTSRTSPAGRPTP